MGTRNNTGFRLNGITRLRYSQYDGYPGGVGADFYAVIRDAIKKDPGLSDLKEKLSNVRIVKHDDAADGADATKYGATFEAVSTGQKTEWYALLRGCQGAGWLRLIISGNMDVFLDDGANIGGQEYAYVLDLDAMTLESYDVAWDGTWPTNHRLVHTQKLDGKLPSTNQWVAKVEKACKG
jgi:hypothetical protein